MAEVTMEVPDRIAAALAPFDGALQADFVVVGEALKLNADRLKNELAEQAEGGLDAGELRRLARRLDQLADAVEAVEGREG